MTSAGMDGGKEKYLVSVVGSANWHSLFGNQ